MRFLTDDWKSDLRKLATGGAWLFVGGSVFALVWLIASGGGWSGQVFGTTVHGQNYSAPLLAYSGIVGVAWIWMQLLTVVTATGLTFMPWARPRRFGHVLLVGWSGLWTLGALRLAMVDPGSFWPVQTVFMATLMACTVFRARRGWFPPEVPPTLRFGDENDELPMTDPGSDALRQLAMEDVTRSTPPVESFTSTANHLCKDLVRFASAAWDRTKAAGRVAVPKVKDAVQRIRRSWMSPSQSA